MAFMGENKYKTFKELFAISKDEMRTLVQKIISEQTLNPTIHLDKEWGIFTELKGLSDEEINKMVEELLSTMTLEQKINQMSGDMPVEQLVTMLIRYNENPYYAGEDLELGIPAVKFSDGPTGVVMHNSTCFPVSMARGATWDKELEEEVGEAIATEVRAQDGNYFAGICMNLLRHPGWGRAQETYGEDTVHIGVMASSLLKGVQKHVMGCIKHYAANSIENTRFKVNVEMDERTLRELYLPHFKKCIDEGASSVMSAYNKFRGEQCGHNKYLQKDILKGEWGFKGFISSDFVFCIRDAKLALEGGMDLEMPATMYWGKNLLEMVKSDEVSEKIIDESVFRILREKIRFAQIGNDKDYYKDKVVCDKHVQLAKRVAEKSIVLLKNKNNLLPLNKEKINKIGVFGKLANTPNTGDMKGSSCVRPPYTITPLEGIKNKLEGKINILTSTGENLNDVREIAKQTDTAIVFVGLTCEDEGEFLTELGGIGGDRANLNLKNSDLALIDAVSSVNPHTIVCVMGGSAIIMEPWKDKVSAILMLWYPGMEGGNALSDIIFGDVNPSAKLPLTIPASHSQLPAFDIESTEAVYDYYHGYLLIDKNNYQPTYPFGYGLSYTTYKYNNLRTNKNIFNKNEEIVVKVDITNTGKMEGEEIVQMYSGYINPSVERHIKDLRGFTKIKLKPGETKTAVIKIKVNDLAYYDDVEKGFKVDKIKYKILVGPSSKNEVLLRTDIEVI